MVYRAGTLRGLAISQIVFGGLMFALGIVSILAVKHWTSYVAFGIWVGIWVIVAGILGYLGARDDNNPNNCLLGCFMGFSITACVISGIMFICYCVAVDYFATVLRCRKNNVIHTSYYPSYYYGFCYSESKRNMASVGAGVGSVLLILSIVEWFVALASSIYCCNATSCCGTPTVATNQQVIQLQAHPVYSGGQTLVIHPTGAVATVPAGATALGQPVYYTQQFASGMPPVGAVPLSYPGTAVVTQIQRPGYAQDVPPPYAYMQSGNAPPSTSAIGSANAEAVGLPSTMDV
ncbi:uncharacterized protein [Montipora capricornis]|uniref:uncharacterized protein isoform X1 n=1 Tax=Montipora capricornis TaxID=246305 RepID=UPI0035F126E7